jgi:hypothetical protein
MQVKKLNGQMVVMRRLATTALVIMAIACKHVLGVEMP